MDIRFEHNLRTREFFIELINDLSVEELNQIPVGFSNNIIWNIVHCMVTQQGLTYGLSDLDLLIPKETVLQFKHGTQPEQDVNREEIENFKKQLKPLLEDTIRDYRAEKFEGFKEYTTSTGYALKNIDDAINLVNIHEGIHLGYAMALKRALKV
ncbi:DinB family protein [Nonlabens antarcticus]|uniref:DinB family protein n=1 Tax=Nonlabens antarcticus TaxID=392714 RepID=UPI001890DAA4|nr:DinB family protein [Nonlabens antarcticus]